MGIQPALINKDTLKLICETRDTTIRVKRTNMDWLHVQESGTSILLHRGGGR
jgi:hypothetical protein